MKPRKPLIHVELGYNSAKEMHKRGRQFPEAMHIGIDNKGKEGESSSNVDLRRMTLWEVLENSSQTRYMR